MGRALRKNGKITVEYTAWSAMIGRCYNSKNPGYKNYGARGIKVCARWRKSVQTFVDDVGLRPSKKHTIDRYPNNEGDYKPSNVRWTMRRNNLNNRRSTIFVKYKGKCVPLSELCQRLKLRYDPILRRITRGGCTPEQAVATKIKVYKPRRK